LSNKYQGRSFIRPSGTENVVRIYVESSIQTLDLMSEIKNLVLKWEEKNLNTKYNVNINENNIDD